VLWYEASVNSAGGKWLTTERSPMVKIVFVNNTNKTPVVRVFKANGVRMSGNCIYGVFNGSEAQIATGTGDLWQVEGRLFNSVEIISDRNKELAA
jgi:hypothetical protein